TRSHGPYSYRRKSTAPPPSCWPPASTLPTITKSWRRKASPMLPYATVGAQVTGRINAAGISKAVPQARAAGAALRAGKLRCHSKAIALGTLVGGQLAGRINAVGISKAVPRARAAGAALRAGKLRCHSKAIALGNLVGGQLAGRINAAGMSEAVPRARAVGAALRADKLRCHDCRRSSRP